MNHLGELCGLGTAFLWSLSAIAWSHASLRIGALQVTAIRAVLAAIVLGIVHLVLFGSLLPYHLDLRETTLLVASGAIAVGVGDLCFFHALHLVGPRIGMLMLTLSPVVSAGLAYLLPPHEKLSATAWAGILLTTAGVAWVIPEKDGRHAWKSHPEGFRTGILLAAAGATLFSVGYLMTGLALKDNAGDNGAAFSGAFIRVAAGAAVTVLALAATRKLSHTGPALRDGVAMRIIAGGTLVGPVFGIWLSTIALQKAEVGVATACINTGPIFMLALAYFSHRERPSWRSIAGTLVAVAGVLLLVLRGSAS